MLKLTYMLRYHSSMGWSEWWVLRYATCHPECAFYENFGAFILYIGVYCKKKIADFFCVFCLSNFAAILDHRLIWAIFQVSGVGRNDFFSKFLLVVKLAFRWGVSFSFSIRKWTGGQIIRSVIIINWFIKNLVFSPHYIIWSGFKLAIIPCVPE